MAEQVGVNPSLIADVDMDPEMLKKLAAEGTIMDMFDQDDDEAAAESVAKSEAAWAEIDEKLAGKVTSDKSVRDLMEMMRTPSGTEQQMTEVIMKRGKDRLISEIRPVGESGEELTMSIVKAWSQSIGRSLSPAVMKRLAEAMLANPSVSVEHLDYILLGWDLRGEHNVNEVKNVMDAHQTLLNDAIKAQREFKEASGSLLTGFREAATKMLTVQKEATSTRTPIRPTPQTSQAPTVRIPILRTQHTLQAPREHTVKGSYADLSAGDRLLYHLNRTVGDFNRFIHTGDASELLDGIADTMTEKDWEGLETKKGIKEILQRISKTFQRANEKAKAQ